MLPTIEPTPWRNRITAHGQEVPNQLLANPRNWRIHPQAQQDALAGLLDQVGWVQDVIVNKRTGHVVDGHLRVSLAISRGEQTIPVVYVDLDEAEEALVLASLDPLAAMAVTDEDALRELIAGADAASEALQALLDGATQSAPAVEPPDAFPSYGEDIETAYRCPSCGYEWSGKPS